MGNFTLESIIFISGFMIFGSFNTLCTKLQFTLTSEGLDGFPKPFSKPWFGSYRMFFAMCMVLVGYIASTEIIGGWSKNKMRLKQPSNVPDGEGHGSVRGFSLRRLSFKTIVCIDFQLRIL